MLKTFFYNKYLIGGYISQFKLGGFLISSLGLSFCGCDLNIPEFISLDITTSGAHPGLLVDNLSSFRFPLVQLHETRTHFSNIDHLTFGYVPLKGLNLVQFKMIIASIIGISLALVYMMGLLISELLKNWWLYVKTKNNCEARSFPRSDEIYSNTNATVIPGEDVNRTIVMTVIGGDDGEGYDDPNNNNNNNGVIHRLPRGRRYTN